MPNINEIELIPAPRYDEVYWAAMNLVNGVNEQTLGFEECQHGPDAFCSLCLVVFNDPEVVESTCETENPEHCDACE